MISSPSTQGFYMSQALSGSGFQTQMQNTFYQDLMHPKKNLSTGDEQYRLELRAGPIRLDWNGLATMLGLDGYCTMQIGLIFDSDLRLRL